MKLNNTLALTAASISLGIFFVFIGLVKVTPSLNEEFYIEWKYQFGRYNLLFPFSKLTGWKPFAKNYRKSIGILEIICGSILVLFPARMKNLANWLLLAVMAYAIYTHLMLSDSFERVAMAVVVYVLLACRLTLSNRTTEEGISQETDGYMNKFSEKKEEETEVFIKKSTQIGSKLSYNKFQRESEEKKIK